MGVTRLICDYCDEIFSDYESYTYNIEGFGEYTVCPDCIKTVNKHIKLVDGEKMLKDYICFVQEQDGSLIFTDSFKGWNNVTFGCYPREDPDLESDAWSLNNFYNYDEAKILLSGKEFSNIVVCWQTGELQRFSLDCDLELDTLFQEIKLYATENNCSDVPIILGSHECLSDGILPESLVYMYSHVVNETTGWARRFSSIDELVMKLSETCDEPDGDCLYVMDKVFLKEHIKDLERKVCRYNDILKALKEQLNST